MVVGNVTMRTIADELDVSVSAVSLALNNKPGIASDLREKILLVSREMGYDIEKINDKKTVKGDLGMLLLHGKKGRDPFSIRALDEAQDEAEQRGFHLLLEAITEEEIERQKVPQFFKKNIQGVIVGSLISSEYVLNVLQKKVPVVIQAGDFSNLPIDSVKADDYMGALRAVNYLLETGHRRIGLIWAFAWHTSNMRRRLAYVAALEQAGIPYDPTIVSEPLSENESDAGYEATKKILAQSKEPPDAFFCVTDDLAAGCMKAIRESGLQIPEDISVIGFDNKEWSRHLHPALTTMNVPMNRMQRLAVKRLTELIESRAREEIERPHTIVLPVELVIRESIADRKHTHASEPIVNAVSKR